MTAEQIFSLFIACGFWLIASVLVEFVESNGHLIWTPRDIYDKTNFNILVVGFCTSVCVLSVLLWLLVSLFIGFFM